MMLDQLCFDVVLADASEVVASAWERGWTIPPKLTVSQWADEHRFIAPGAGAEPGKWRTSRNPPQREIQDALSEHSPVLTVHFMKPGQWGATEIGINWAGYVIERGLDSMLVAQPVKELARSWATAKFNPAAAMMPALNACIQVDNTLEKKYAGGSLWAIWTKSANQLRQRSARFIFADEIDEYPDDVEGQGPADELLEVRARSFGDRGKFYGTCTPTVAGRSKIQRGYEAGDQRRYKVPCPHCSAHHFLEIERLSPRGTFACPACGGEIEEHHKTAMLVERSACKGCGDVPVRLIHHVAEGRMVFADQCECGTTLNPPSPDGAYWEPSNSNAPRSHRSYHIWAAYTPEGLGLSWPAIAAERAAAEAHPEKRVSFYNVTLGLPFEGERTQQDADEVMALAEPGVHRGVVPAGSLILVAGVDFQHDRAEIQVIGKGRGQRTRIIDYAVVECDPSRPDGYEAVDEYLVGTWLNSRGIPMTISSIGLDGGNWTEVVAQFVKSKVSFSGNNRMLQVAGEYRRQHLYLIRGRAEKKSDRAVYRPRKSEVNQREKTVARSVGVWGVGTSVLKHIVYGWLGSAVAARAECEASGEPDDIDGRMIRFPGGRGEAYDPLRPDPGALLPSYYKGLTVEFFDLGAQAWVTPRGARNEPLDTLIYAEWAALAPAIKVDVIRESQWVALETKFEPPHDLFAPSVSRGTTTPPATAPVVSRGTSTTARGTRHAGIA